MKGRNNKTYALRKDLKPNEYVIMKTYVVNYLQY
jgi:hypothetical protein